MLIAGVIAQAAASASAVLLVLGDGRLKTIELTGRELVIGRSRTCDVVIDHEVVSRRHAILRSGPPATVQDLDSTHGTRVAGKLRHGGGPIELGGRRWFHVGPFVMVIVRRAAHHGRGPASGESPRMLDSRDSPCPSTARSRAAP
jgi:pSer/pThr/pTyr-binding forkhead associated (FHA) protein